MNTLLIDIGNSRIKGRLVDAGTGSLVDLRPTTADRLPEDWLASVGATVDVAFISNVASVAVERAVVEWLLMVSPTIRIEQVRSAAAAAGVINGYRDPGRLGPDRWMALIGAHAMFPDRSLLVCGFGTATTLDLLVDAGADAPATFVGGSILPGGDAMHAALSAGTARLGVKPGRVVDFADTTEDAIASGVRLAQRGALREAWTDARQRVAGRLECVIAGGAGDPMTAVLEPLGAVVHHVPDLVLHGLMAIATPTGATMARASVHLAAA